MRPPLKGIHSDARELAREIYAERKAMHAEPADWQPVNYADFPHVDSRYYEEATEFLRTEGFAVLGDRCDARFSRRHPDMRTFVRFFVTPDGAVAAAVHHQRPTGRERQLRIDSEHYSATGRRTLALWTEFLDRTFLGSANAKESSVQGIEYAGITTQYLVRQAPLSSVLKVHRAALTQCQEDPKHAPVLPLRTLEDIVMSDERDRQVRREHLCRMGFIDEKAELPRWRQHFANSVAQMLVTEIAAMKTADPENIAFRK